jgi:hypothetical protein
MSLSGEEVVLSSRLPKLKFGFGIVAFFFICQIVWATQRTLHPGSRESGGYAAALTLISAFVLTAYILHCISAYHYAVSDVEGWNHPITPRRAVRFHFIPIFNLYWNYKWPWEVARFVNWRTQQHRMSGVLVGTAILTGALVGALLDTCIGALIILSSFAYMSRCLRDAFAAPPVPPELHANSGLDAAGLTTDN